MGEAIGEFIDEAAFTKNGDNHDDDSTMALWEKGIKPTLYDEAGHPSVCSNSAGKNPNNFFFNICNDPSHGFQEYHATTMENPLLPKRAAKESFEAWLERHLRFLAPIAYLSPRIIEAIAEGSAPADLTVTGLARNLPRSWSRQEERLCIA